MSIFKTISGSFTLKLPKFSLRNFKKMKTIFMALKTSEIFHNRIFLELNIL